MHRTVYDSCVVLAAASSSGGVRSRCAEARSRALQLDHADPEGSLYTHRIFFLAGFKKICVLSFLYTKAFKNSKLKLNQNLKSKTSVKICSKET